MAAQKEFSSALGDATVIGPSILISGKLSGDEDLTVRGRVEGELSLTKTLIVETSGIVKANVQVKNAIVSGVVVGNISATESVELTREGRMVGDIRSPRVIIVDGASFRGRIDMGEGVSDRASNQASTALTRPVMRPVTRAPSLPVATQRPITRPAVPVRAPQAAPARPMSIAPARPMPPVPPKMAREPAKERAQDESKESKPAVPPPPPQPVLVGEAGKKKVLLKKKK
jgi:cytoskeletal protein CcmA (bactofilin family)